MDAINALANLTRVNGAVSRSVQRLSSGLKVASPGDDPSQYVQANGFQSQVDSLNTLIAGNQHTINLVKSTTAGLSQISAQVSIIKSAAQDAVTNIGSNYAAALADQQTIQTALQSINNIVTSTSFGNKRLLDGSAGLAATISDATKISGLSINGASGNATSAAGNVVVTVTTAASYAVLNGAGSATYATVNASISLVGGKTTGNGGNVNINGQTITVQASDTVQTLLGKINAVSSQTGVSADFVSGNGSGYVQLVQQGYGANFKISTSETAKLVTGQASPTTSSGTNAVVSASFTQNLNGATSTTTTTLTGGQLAGDSGLKVSDAYGNSLTLTQGANTTATSNATVGSLASGPVQVQVGTNSGQTVSLALPTAFASSLGTSSGLGSLASIDVTSVSGASNAVQIATSAVAEINTFQAQLGSFQINVVQAAINVLSSTAANLSASVTSIRAVDPAAELTNLYNLQALQQAGLSGLKSAAASPSYYLRLLQ